MTQKENSEPQESGVTLWKFAGAEFDELKWELRVGGQTATLEPRPLEILLCLLRHAGETVTKEELLQSVWGHAYLSENALSNAIGKLRKALHDEAQHIIVTIYKVGYRLAVPVHRTDPPGRPKPRLGLKRGDTVPGRLQWRLERELDITPGSEVWLALPSGAAAEGAEAAADGTAAAADAGQRVFKFSPDGRQLSSLKREAALARLLQGTLGERPELIRVLDWGFDQPPFFIACEYGGSSLPEWLEANGGIAAQPLSLRLELMAQVAEAVAMAHSVGVLHKDLKPGNVLIDSGSDGAPRARLTDFGSGSLTDPARLAEWGLWRLDQTATARGITGTPMYMAPEVLQGHSPTVQSDLYALGVMLYQLAVGDLRRPLVAGWERQVDDELLRLDIADAASGTPEHRLTSARELAERLRQLDQRRLALQGSRRQLAATAEATRILERSRARRPWLIAAGMALSVGLLTSLFFYRQALLSRNDERSEAEMVRAVNGFLNNDLLAAANPNVGGSMEVSVRDAIARASGRIDARFASSPAMAVALHQTVGSAYRTLGQYSDAEREFRRARQLSQPAFGATAVISQTSDLLLAQDLAYENKYDEAQALLAPIDGLIWNQPQLDPMVRTRDWDVHTLLDGHHGNLLAAAADAEQTQAALDGMRKQHPHLYQANRDYIYLASLHVGTALQQAGDVLEAEKIEHALLDQIQAERGPGDPLTMQARERWLASLIDLGRSEQAAVGLSALQRDMETLGSRESPLHLEFLRDEAALAAAQQHWPEAIHQREQVEAGYSKLFGVDNDASIRAMADSAATLRAAGRFADAIDKYLDAYGLLQERYPGGLLTQKVAYGLVATCLDAGRPAQAGLYLGQLNAAALSAAVPNRNWGARLAYQRGRMAQLSGDKAEAQRQFALARRVLLPGSEPDLAARIERALNNNMDMPRGNLTRS